MVTQTGNGKVTHHMRPGPIRGTQVLCENAKAGKGGDYLAELNKQGVEQVNCEDCKFIRKELMTLWGVPGWKEVQA